MHTFRTGGMVFSDYTKKRILFYHAKGSHERSHHTHARTLTSHTRTLTSHARTHAHITCTHAHITRTHAHITRTNARSHHAHTQSHTSLSLHVLFCSCSFRLSRSTALQVVASTLDRAQLLDYTRAVRGAIRNRRQIYTSDVHA